MMQHGVKLPIFKPGKNALRKNSYGKKERLSGCLSEWNPSVQENREAFSNMLIIVYVLPPCG
jgi:hypothetical protein